VESAGHHDDRPLPRFGGRGPDPLRHVRLACGVRLAGCRLTAYEIEVDRESLRQIVVGGDLEEVVPQHVHVVDA
jgi:hypothetical protein